MDKLCFIIFFIAIFKHRYVHSFEIFQLYVFYSSYIVCFLSVYH